MTTQQDLLQAIAQHLHHQHHATLYHPDSTNHKPILLIKDNHDQAYAMIHTDQHHLYLTPIHTNTNGTPITRTYELASPHLLPQLTTNLNTILQLHTQQH